ncbi:hypothetical protein KY285_010968 [Solanum tuberosum]|nr:hypothetical protein KY285_010968 [Solanum tuberosum]
MVDTTTEGIPLTGQVPTNVVIDSGNLIFLYASDAPGMNLVNNIFDGRGYQGWRRSLLIALSAKNKLGFINGNCPEPPATANDFSSWHKCNDMVTSWLLNSLSKDIAHSVIYSRTAKDLWTDLEQRFGQSNGAKLYHLQKELTELMQGSTDIAGYFTKLKRLWDELDSLNSHVGCKCVCICEGKHKMTKFVEDQRLIQFLMGLNDVYAQARGNILMLNPLPGINQAYSLLLQDENQREVYTGPQFPPNNSSFMTGNPRSENQMQRFGNPNHSQQRFGGHPQNFGGQFQGQRISRNNQKISPPLRNGKGRRKKYNPNVSCTHCLKTGHVEDDCYRLIGYPEDFQFTKGFQAPIKGNATITDVDYDHLNIGTDETDDDLLSQLSRHQISQIKHIFNQGQHHPTSSNHSKINAHAVAGTITTYSGSCFCMANSKTWIIDSGASKHM